MISAVRFTDSGFVTSRDPTDESVGYDRGPHAGIPRGVGDIRPLRGLIVVHRFKVREADD